VAELARGNVADRPWGRTFATLGLRGVTGQLCVFAEGKRFLVGFEHGAVIAAASPLASDAAVRVALTSHLVSSSQVPEISRRQAAAPERDEVALIAELARLGPDHTLRLRRRVIAQRAARTFSINQGEFVVTDRLELDVLEGCELDVRAVVYMGARANLSEQRLSAELGQLGAWFQLKSGLDEDLPQFGFTDVEQPVIERLRDGGTLAEIEDFATSFIDGRTVRAVIYALASCNACELEPAAGVPRSTRPSRPMAAQPAPVAAGLPRLTGSQPTESTQPMQPIAAADEPPAHGTTQPLTRTSPAPAAPARPDPRGPRPTPDRVAAADRSGGIPQIQAARRAVMPLGPAARPATAAGDDAEAHAVVKSKTTTRIGTVPPPPRPPPSPLAAGASAPRPPEVFDGPTRDEAEPADGGRSRRPTEEATGWDSRVGARAPTRDSLGRSSPSLRLPPDEAIAQDSAPTRRLDEARGRGRRPSDELGRRDESSGSIRLPGEDAPRRDAASGSIAIPGPVSGQISSQVPGRGSGDDASRDPSSPELRRPVDDARRRPSSSPGLRRPIDRAEAGPGVVVRPVVATRPPPERLVARVDTPQSHSVKALIAQRLKLLDQGADHFQLLGVAHDVAPEPLRKAYFALARQLHPDRLAALGISDDGKHAQRLFAQINTGFAILSDQGRRARYVDVLRRGGEAAVRAEQARAEELARRILDAEEAFRRGELALRRDQPQAAVGELERAVQLNPDEPDYHAALAWARFAASPDRAAAAAATRAALERAIQRAPRSVTARFYLGRVERMVGRDQEALRHFRDVIAAVPGHAEAASEIRAIEARQSGGDKPGRRR